MKFSEHNWLISYNFLLRFLIFMVGMHACNSVMYIPYKDLLIHGRKVEKECSKESLKSARINNSLTLGIAKNATTDDNEYWTGLSWHHNTFYWDKDRKQPTSVEDEVVDKPDQNDRGWKCFWIKKSVTKLKATECNNDKRYICEKEGMHACNSVMYIPYTDPLIHGDKVKKECSKASLKSARIYNSLTLAIAKNATTDDNEYWTGLSWHQNTFYWDKDRKQPTSVEDEVVDKPDQNDKGWKCFWINKSVTKVKATECNNDKRYICEKEETSTCAKPTPTTTSKISTSNLESKPVSTLPDASTWAKPTSSTTSKISTSNLETKPFFSQPDTSTWTKPTSSTTLKISTSNLETKPVSSQPDTSTWTKPTSSTTSKISASNLETKPVSSQPDTSTWTKPTSSTTSNISTSNSEPKPVFTQPEISTFKHTAITTMLTPVTTIVTSTTTTLISSGSLTSAPLANTVLTSSRMTTAVINEKESISLTTSGTESSIAEHPNKNGTTHEKQTARERLEHYIKKVKALKATERSSLQNAANTTSTFFEDLKNNQDETKDINVLVATQELELFAIEYGKLHYTTNESTVISKKNYAMKIRKVPADTLNAVVFSVNETDYSATDGWASISLPPVTFEGQDAVVVLILYNDIKQWVPDEGHVELGRKRFPNLELQSRIIASTVDPKPPGVLKENVTISFTFDKETKEEDIPHCVFWDFTIKSQMNGSWSSKGCSLVKKVNKEATCTCNHLTNFAVLMQVGGNKEVPSAAHRKVLEVITYVGCALSLTGEALTIIAYCVLMNLKQEQIQIRLNLVVAIAIAQIVFLSGIDASERKEVCVFVAALIHYFYLAGFAWMLFEGVYLYLMVVKVFNTVVRIRLFYAVAWGFPFLVVVLSLVIASSQDGSVHSYVHGEFCWVSFTNNLVWTFVTPVLVVCLINAVILGRVVHEIVTMQNDKPSELDRMRQGAKACVVLFPLLGMTWVFGVLSVTEAGLAFQYIFTILNSLQGFFIFVLHVLRNGDVRAAFHRKKQKWLEVKSVTSSRTTHHGSSNMWTHKVSSETNEMNSIPSHVTPRPASGFSNQALVLPHERTMTPVDT